MGKISKQIKTGTKISEQIINKMAATQSLKVILEQTNFDQGTALHFQSLGFLPQNQTVEIKRDKDGIVSKVRLGNHFYCSETFSLKRKCNDHFA